MEGTKKDLGQSSMSGNGEENLGDFIKTKENSAFISKEMCLEAEKEFNAKMKGNEKNLVECSTSGNREGELENVSKAKIISKIFFKQVSLETREACNAKMKGNKEDLGEYSTSANREEVVGDLGKSEESVKDFAVNLHQHEQVFEIEGNKLIQKNPKLEIFQVKAQKINDYLLPKIRYMIKFGNTLHKDLDHELSGYKRKYEVLLQLLEEKQMEEKMSKKHHHE